MSQVEHDQTKISRRRMLQFMGAAGAWMLMGCEQHSELRRVQLVPTGWNRGEERWVRTTCLQCPGGCGINVRVYEGRAVKIEGNPDHPLNQGGLCPKGQAGLQALYDPDRIPGPMKKIGGRSSSTWEAISWDEALATVADKLGQLRAAGKPESLLLLGGHFPGHMKALFERLAAAYGTPNLVSTESLDNSVGRLSKYLTQGISEPPGYDLANTRHLLFFGDGYLEAWQPLGYTLRTHGRSLRGRLEKRTRIVIVEPHFGVGASKADEWIPIRPGTYAALALGMAHVIVKEDLFDREFVANHTFGFDDWEDPTERGVRHEGFRSLVTREYSPEDTEKITGVAAADIRRLAREFAEARPGVAAAGQGPELHTNGLFTHLAIRSLNGLVGSIDVPGGEIVQQSVPSQRWSDANLDDRARTGNAQPSLARRTPRQEGLPGDGDHGALLDAIESGQPYPTEVALIYNTNPLFDGPDVVRYRQALDRIPFVVSFSSFMDETTARADLVLPDSTYLERLEDDFILPSVGHPVLNLRQPVMDKLHDTRHTADVVIELAGRIGGSVGSSFPWKNYEQALKESLAGVAAAGNGSFTGRNSEDFWDKLKARGTWSGADYRFGDWERVLKTPSGRFEFASLAWKEHIEAAARQAGVSLDTYLDQLGIRARGDLALLPHYEPPRFAGVAEQFPFYLQTFKTMMYAEGRGGNQPWLQESFGVMLSERWRAWVEINPATAERLGIADHDMVRIESDRGRLQLPARLHPGVRPDMVNVPLGYGHTEHGRWAKGTAGNPNDIISGLVDPVTGAQAMHATRVKVGRVSALGESEHKSKGSS